MKTTSSRRKLGALPTVSPFSLSQKTNVRASNSPNEWRNKSSTSLVTRSSTCAVTIGKTLGHGRAPPNTQSISTLQPARCRYGLGQFKVRNLNLQLFPVSGENECMNYHNGLDQSQTAARHIQTCLFQSKAHSAWPPAKKIDSKPRSHAQSIQSHAALHIVYSFTKL